jgi:hypothetical protein
MVLKDSGEGELKIPDLGANEGHFDKGALGYQDLLRLLSWCVFLGRSDPDSPIPSPIVNITCCRGVTGLVSSEHI